MRPVLTTMLTEVVGRRSRTGLTDHTLDLDRNTPPRNTPSRGGDAPLSKRMPPRLLHGRSEARRRVGASEDIISPSVAAFIKRVLNECHHCHHESCLHITARPSCRCSEEASLRRCIRLPVRIVVGVCGPSSGWCRCTLRASRGNGAPLRQAAPDTSTAAGAASTISALFLPEG